jgi:hypothetical protein
MIVIGITTNAEYLPDEGAILNLAYSARRANMTNIGGNHTATFSVLQNEIRQQTSRWSNAMEVTSGL